MNILPQDKKLAEHLVDFGAFCLSQARLEWLRDQLDGAEKWAEEFLRCKQYLGELIKRKQRYDELAQIIETLREAKKD